MVCSKSNRLLFGQTNGQDVCTCHPYFDVYAKHTYIFNSPPPADKSDQQYSKDGSRPWHLFFVFVFLSGFSSQTLTIHSTAGEGRGPSFIPLYHFHPLTNIETFICNFARSVYIWYTVLKNKMLVILACWKMKYSRLQFSLLKKSFYFSLEIRGRNLCEIP